jgi:excisionase family DNA binding protein
VGDSSEALVLTPSEARKLLRCSRAVIYAAIKTGRIPSIRISPRKIIIPKARFLEWLNEAGGNNLHLEG